MAKQFNDPSVTGVTSVDDAGRYVHFDGSTGEVFYQTRANMQAQNRGTQARDTNATKTISAHGTYTHTGTGSTWTISDGIVGFLFLFNAGTGNITLSASLNSSMLTAIGPESGRILWWDGTEYVGIT